MTTGHGIDKGRILCPETRGPITHNFNETFHGRVPTWITLDACKETICPSRRGCRSWNKYRLEKAETESRV